MKGLDICYHQGTINFKKVKASGYDFIIPRDGWGVEKIDPKLVEYTKQAKASGISVPGVFHFVYAINLQEAIQNAWRAVKNVEAAELPKSTVIWCDIEYDTVKNAMERGVELTNKMQREFAEAFCNFCLAQGYPSGIYCNSDYIQNVYGEDIIDSYDIWLADLYDDPDYPCVYQQYDWNVNLGFEEDADADKFIGNYTAGTAKPREAGKGEKLIKATTLLGQIHDTVDNIPTVYEQAGPELWGAWNGSAFRLDCIIFIKCLVFWGWYYPDKAKKHGGAVYDGDTDFTEIELLNHCTDVKKTGFLSAEPCELLYMDGHCGFKIDEFMRNGNTYNVAECTVATAWGSPRKCLYSYVDDNGYRYSCKGGTPNGRWSSHGKLMGIEYDYTKPDPEPAEKETKIDTTKFISYLPWIRKGSKGEMVTLLQSCLKELGYYHDVIDGMAGNNTDSAIKAYQKDAGLYPDGIFGNKSWTKLICG